MVLSNVEILAAIQRGEISIANLAGFDPAEKPFNTSVVDLRLGTEISIPKRDLPAQFDLRQGGIASFLAANSDGRTLEHDQGFTLKPGTFILANTIEKVSFPISEGQCYSA